MCWPDENEKTVALMRDNPMCQIIVATVAFGQGFNIKTLLDSIQVGLPRSVPQTLQQAGRVGRDPSTIGRAVVLVQASAYASAEKFLARGAPASRAPAKTSKNLTTMNNEKALMLTAKGCLIAFFNKLFGNTGEGSEVDCIALPRRLPCSNCLPRFSGSLIFDPSPLPSGPERLRPFAAPEPPAAVAGAYRPKTNKLTRKMRSSADAELRKFRVLVQKLERDYDIYGYIPASSYLSNPVITSLLDNLLVIWTREVLVTKIPHWKYHERHGEAIFALIKSLQIRFAADFEAARLEKNRKARMKRRAAADREEMSDDGMVGNSDGAGEGSDMEEELEEIVSSRAEPTRKRRILEDTTNTPPSPKRIRAARAPLEKMKDTLETYGPKYKPRIRRNNVED
ncbi:ATP-dependent DNA helicase RecQ [Mycena venus]|uniref:ATP-dependent DNA helicase RecQ n=1 Tax=Mycena venus TaxID=2733690 RepID=A0A8H6WTR3_9AGAR|nr:ATP-dependent DNA helicase RecQ [Mycena venus]